MVVKDLLREDLRTEDAVQLPSVQLRFLSFGTAICFGKIFMADPVPLASGGRDLNELVEDAKALSRVWEMYEGLLKKHRLVHSSVEMESFLNNI